LSKNTRRKAGRVVPRKLADGTVKVYRYGPYRPKRPRLAADSIDALIRAYQRSPEWAKLAPKTRQLYLIYLRPLEEVGHLTVKGFGRRELLILRDGIASQRGHGAAAGFVRAASALFTFAVDREWIEHSPAARAAKGLAHGHLRAWTRQEADLAQAGLPEHLRRVVVLARYTGQRRGDLCALPWSAYDGATIRLVQQKTGEPLVLPAHPELKAELDRWRGELKPEKSASIIALPSATILTNTLGRPWKPQHLSHELPVALARIGISPDLNVHGLRKLAATELADAGCSTHEIASITGHRTLAMVALYTRSADQERLAGAAVIKLSERTNANNRRKA
jgi:integrase